MSVNICEIKKVIKPGKIDWNETGRRINDTDFEVSLRLVHNGKKEILEFSVCADVWNSRHTDIVTGGQCIDDVADYFRHNKLVQNIRKYWHLYHLNTMHPGLREQENYLALADPEERKKIKEELTKNRIYRWGLVDNYDVNCELLKRAGLYEIKVVDDEQLLINGSIMNGKYKYGHGWVATEIPIEDLEDIITIFDFESDEKTKILEHIERRKHDERT